MALPELTPAEFYRIVTTKSAQSGLRCMDIVNDYMARKNVEPDYVVTLINSDLKKILAREATDLNLLKRTAKKHELQGL